MIDTPIQTGADTRAAGLSDVRNEVLAADSSGTSTPGRIAQHPLLQRLVSHHGASLVGPADAADWEARPGTSALLFSGDPVRFPEGLDVAVVLPELQAAFPGAFRIGVAEREQEEAFARRYGSQRWPSLVFLRDGAYLGVVSGMKDWTVYLEEVAAVLAATPRRAPTVGIPVVAAGADASACH
jgi:hydrogenase-1 operon protein HyaE